MVLCIRTISLDENTQNNINQPDRVSYLSRRAIVRIFLYRRGLLRFNLCRPREEKKTLYYNILHRSYRIW